MEPVTIRLSEEEKAWLNRLVERIQQRMPKGATATQRSTILAGLEHLENYLDRLDKDKNRPR